MAASKAAETLGFGVSVTLVTLVTADSVRAPTHAEKRLAGIVPPRTADYPGRQDIEPHRAMPRDFDRLRRFAVAGGDDQPALDHRPCQCRSIKALGDLAPPLLRQHHVFPAAVMVAPAESGAIDHPLGAVLPCSFEPRAAICLDIGDHLADGGFDVVIAGASAPSEPGL